MALGDIVVAGQAPMLILTPADAKVGVDVAIGDVVKYDTDGWQVAAAADVAGQLAVALDAVVIADTDRTMRVLLIGTVVVKKTAGAAIAGGQAVEAGATGAVIAWGGINAIVGLCTEPALLADTVVEIQTRF